MHIVFFLFLIYSKILIAQDLDIEEYKKKQSVENQEHQEKRLAENVPFFFETLKKTVHSVVYRPASDDFADHVIFTLFITYSPYQSLHGLSKNLANFFSVVPKNKKECSKDSSLSASLPTFGGKHALFSLVMLEDKVYYTASSAILQCTKQGINKHFQRTLKEILPKIEETLASTYHVLQCRYKRLTYVDWTDSKNTSSVYTLMSHLFPTKREKGVIQHILGESPYYSLLETVISSVTSDNSGMTS